MTPNFDFPANLVVGGPPRFERADLDTLVKPVAEVAAAIGRGVFLHAPTHHHSGWRPKSLNEEHHKSGPVSAQAQLLGAEAHVSLKREASGLSVLRLRVTIYPSRLDEKARTRLGPALEALATWWRLGVGRAVRAQLWKKKERPPSRAGWVSLDAVLHTFSAANTAVPATAITEIIAHVEPVFREYLEYRLPVLRSQYRSIERYGGAADPMSKPSLPIIERLSVIRQLLVALHTRPLVLLAGVSGSGKSKIARYIGRAWSEFDESVFEAARVAQQSKDGRVFAPYEKALLDSGSFTVDGEWCSMLLPPPDADEAEVDAAPEDPAAIAASTGLDDDEGQSDDAGDEPRDGSDDGADDGPEDGDAVSGGRGPRRFAMVPVRADWQEAASLWGYADHNQRFHSTDALDVALNAWEDPGIGAYVLVLDEMNLSRLEHYGSDLLSAMECPGEPMIRLHGGLPAETTTRGIPHRIGFAGRLRVIGTVNVDETTFSFAPKVLDRAAVLEFLEVDLKRICGGHKAWGLLEDWFAAVQEALEPHALHLGYRSANEILDAVHAMGADATHLAIDAQFRNKVLTRVRGPRGAAEPVLLALLAIARHGPTPQAAEKADLLAWHQDGMLVPRTGAAVYPEAAKKTLHMLRRARDVGFTSFF